MELKINTWIKDNKIPLIMLLTLLGSMLMVVVLYMSQGHQFVETMYRAGWLQRFESATNTYSLEQYLKQADWLFYEAMKDLFVTLFVYIFILSLATIPRFKKYMEFNSLEWFCLVAGLFFIQWYSWSMDDAYVNLRYIDNLLFLKNGLVYNKGEYVEGFSSPFMVILLTLLRTTGLNWLHIMQLITTVSFVLFWFMLVKLNRMFSPSSRSIMNFSLIYLTFNYAVLCSFSSWMETPIVQVIAAAYALYILNPLSLVLQVTLAISPLVRHELIVPFILCSIWAWRQQKEFPTNMVLMMIFFVGSWVLFRIYYYADLFPNTFYYKNTVNIKQGLVYVHNTFGTYHFYEVLGIFLILIYLLKRKGVKLELSKRAMVVIAALPVLLYVVKIGGDWTHYRYLAFPFILMVCSFSGILEHFMKEFDLSKYRAAVPLTVVVLSVLIFSFYPVQLKRHPIFLSSIYNNSVPEEKAMREYLLDKLRITDAASIMHIGRRINFGYTTDMLEQIKMLNKDKEFKYSEIEIGLWCENDYENIRKRIIHGWGLTDAILARIQVDITGMSGHSPVIRFAEDILDIQKASEYFGRGMYRKAVEEGRAPEWIIKNLDTIETIERKIYNNHDFLENLKLAFTFPPRIKP